MGGPAGRPRATGGRDLDRRRDLAVARGGTARHRAPRDHRVHRAVPRPAARDGPSGPRRLDLDALSRDLARAQARGAGGRGHRLLHPPWLRARRDAERARGRAAGPRAAARGVHHHPAARQEPLALPVAQPAAQGAGGAPDLAGRARALQAAHSRALSQRGRVRPRHLRGGRGEPALLRQGARRPRRERGSPARRRAAESRRLASRRGQRGLPAPPAAQRPPARCITRPARAG